VAFSPYGPWFTYDNFQVHVIDTVELNLKYIFKTYRGHAQKRPFERHTFVRENNIKIDNR